MKDSKEIVENILRMRGSDYELPERAEVVTSRKAIILRKENEQEANVFPKADDNDFENTHVDDEVLLEGSVTIEEMESYQPAQELHFEVSEVKEKIEKKKKRRNYIEFRPDYSKIV